MRQEEGSMKKWITLAVAVAVLTFTGCSGKSEKKSEAPGKFEFKGPGDTSIKQGGEEKIHVTVKRANNYRKAVEFNIEGLPDGVTAEGTEPHQIEENKDKADITLKAKADAKTIADKEVKVTWKAGDDKGETKFKLTVKTK